MLEDKELGSQIPEFRAIALEEQFCKHLSAVCDIFKEFGEMKEEAFNIP